MPGLKHTRQRSVGPPAYAFAMHRDQNGENVEENLQLVPCRGSSTGWKYVQMDPSQERFFTNPNRVNSFGYTQQKFFSKNKLGQSLDREFCPAESEFQTSYGRFFNPGM